MDFEAYEKEGKLVCTGRTDERGHVRILHVVEKPENLKLEIKPKSCTERDANVS